MNNDSPDLPEALKRLRILIAEDDEITAKILEAMAETLGYKTMVAANGSIAWELYQAYHPRIILTDWQMPEMTGVELCKKVRAAETDQYTYIVILTAAFTRKENYQEAMAGGADDFLAKPYNREELAARLRVAERIVNFHSQVRELRQLIPICSYCKSIRKDENYWQQIETYLHSTGSLLTHGICPACAEEHFKYLEDLPKPDVSKA
jgi:sigma-B regulation protein RsbU (phosphoserine phosphatase)